MFTLDAPIVAQTAFGGGNGLPPVKDNGALVITGGKPQPAPRKAAQPVSRPAYPRPAAWAERRIALCESHHARFLVWRAANIAKLKAWVMSQSDYCPAKAAQEAYSAKLRAASRQRRQAQA